MKKLLFLSIFALFVLVSANVFGQAGRGATPSVGSTHTYWVNGTASTHSTDHVGNKYTWWISTNTADLNEPVTTPTDFTPASGGASYNTATTNGNMIKLTWNPTSAGQNYFLVVKEEDPSGAKCSNLKAYLIQPKNDFKLLFTALESDQSTAIDNAVNCAPDIKLTASGTEIIYNYGGGDYEFKLTATGLYSGWSFTNAFDNVMGDGSDYTVMYKIGESGEWLNNASNITVDANPSGSEVVYFRVKGTNETFEGTSQQTMSLTLTEVTDGHNSPVITNHAGTDISTNAIQTQTVKARPATSQIDSE